MSQLRAEEVLMVYIYIVSKRTLAARLIFEANAEKTYIDSPVERWLEH